MTMRTIPVSLHDYAALAELRIQATRLALAYGVGVPQQGLVALAVTGAGIFLLEHAHEPSALLCIDDEGNDPRFLVVVHDASTDAGDAEELLRETAEDPGLMLAEHAAERFSVQTGPVIRVAVTLGWALPPAEDAISRSRSLPSTELAGPAGLPPASPLPHRWAEGERVSHLVTKAVLAEHDRIAREIHDGPIQRLFSCGMALQNVLMLDHRPEVADRIAVVIDELDAAISQMRSTIFETYHRPLRAIGLRAQILELGSSLAEVLGFAPSIRFEGPVDLDMSSEVSEHLVAVVREALSNVARHAHATRVDVIVHVDAAAGGRGSPLDGCTNAAFSGTVTVTVTDNGEGVGSGEVVHRSGLANLAARAEEVGGTFTVSRNADGGTCLQWSAAREELSGRHVR